MYGQVLKELRVEKGLAQQQLSVILGFKSPSAIGMVEREERELSAEKIIALANYFNVSIDYLLGITPFKNRTSTHYSVFAKSSKIKGYKDIDLLENIENAEDALKLLLCFPVLSEYSDYDLNNMPDEEIT